MKPDLAKKVLEKKVLILVFAHPIELNPSWLNLSQPLKEYPALDEKGWRKISAHSPLFSLMETLFENEISADSQKDHCELWIGFSGIGLVETSLNLGFALGLKAKTEAHSLWHFLFIGSYGCYHQKHQLGQWIMPDSSVLIDRGRLQGDAYFPNLKAELGGEKLWADKIWKKRLEVFFQSRKHIFPTASYFQSAEMVKVPC